MSSRSRVEWLLFVYILLCGSHDWSWRWQGTNLFDNHGSTRTDEYEDAASSLWFPGASGPSFLACSAASIISQPQEPPVSRGHEDFLSRDETIEPSEEFQDGGEETDNTVQVSGTDQQALVNIFIELQKMTEEEQGITHTEPEEEKVDYFYEDDIVLTVPQAEHLLHDAKEEIEHRKRKKRKLAEPLAKRWDLPIPYMFDGSHSHTERGRIRLALAYWEELTCIRFRELTYADLHIQQNVNHLQNTEKLVFARGRGCWSYVGYTRQINQTLSIGSGCQSNGTIAHEVGHAVGFWHEQSRPDRDNYININRLNVTDGKLYNFAKRSWGEIITMDIPYDLGSDMHYGSKFYARDQNATLTTVSPRDHLMSRVIGQRQELSFYDVKLANKAYCQDVCTTPLPQPCQRDGYQDPRNCSRCRCADGFTGNYCERVAFGRNAFCGGVADARYNGTIYNPGYPGSYRPDVACTWLIRAPEGSHVYVQFVGEFGLKGHQDVCKDYVEVRYYSSLALTGARFCMSDVPREPIRSDGNEMLVLFRSYEESRSCDDSKFPWKCQVEYNTGFRANYFTKSCGGCQNNNGQMQSACVRRVSFTCAQTWHEKKRVDCPSWWYTDGCGDQTLTMTRYAQCHRDEHYCCAGYMLDKDQCKPTPAPSSYNIIPTVDAHTDYDGFQGSQHVPDQSDDHYLGHLNPGVDIVQPGGGSSDSSASSQYPSVIWTEWGEWSQCPVQCGGGMAVRSRSCLAPAFCGSSKLQEDKKPCNQKPCSKRCATERRILCDLWTTCTRTVYKACNFYCYGGFVLQGTTCTPVHSG